MKKLKFSFAFLKKLPEKEKRITLSTMITLSRIILVVPIIYAMAYAQWSWAFWLFILASITDTLDGTLARLFNEKTFLGACLDPLADKLLVISCFFTLAFVQSPFLVIPGWFFALVLIKELVTVVGALALYWRKGYLEIKPTRIGKSTTFVQLIFIGWLFLCHFCHWMPIKTYYAALIGISLLMVISLIQYIRIGLRYLVAA